MEALSNVFYHLPQIALYLFQKISKVYGNTLHLPKQELSKIDYNLISRYLAYENDNAEIDLPGENEDNATSNITQKIIKRINFFSEEFPFKLRKLDKIIKSKKIFVFGYDIYYRLTFYLKPYKDRKLNQHNVQIDYMDYIIYIFFVLEVILPIIRENFNFSDQINLVIDYDDYDLDTEMIRFLFHYINSYYPLILGKVHIVRFDISNLKKNLAFRKDLSNLDLFNVLRNLKILELDFP
jgi:hypothetical protein